MQCDWQFRLYVPGMMVAGTDLGRMRCEKIEKAVIGNKTGEKSTMSGEEGVPFLGFGESLNGWYL